MKVTALHVVREGEVVWAWLVSQAGSFWAIWNGGQPRLGEQYHVELEVGRLARQPEIVQTPAPARSAITGPSRDKPVVLTGRVLHLFEDEGTMRIELGDGTVEIEGQAPVDAWVNFEALPMTAFDANL